eukprot:scaffold22277_cov70-Skeletonema_dohrnii-CCMP3373.AAC.2
MIHKAGLLVSSFNDVCCPFTRLAAAFADKHTNGNPPPKDPLVNLNILSSQSFFGSQQRSGVGIVKRSSQTIHAKYYYLPTQ